MREKPAFQRMNRTDPQQIVEEISGGWSKFHRNSISTFCTRIIQQNQKEGTSFLLLDSCLSSRTQINSRILTLLTRKIHDDITLRQPKDKKFFFCQPR
jgi:hypothetical protein